MGPIEPAAITAATLLATKALEGFGSTVGESTWSGMGQLVTLVRGKVTGQPEAEITLAQVEQHPDDHDRVQALAELLAALAAHDAAFHRQLAALVAEARQDATIGAFTTHVEGLATAGQIINLAQVQGGVHFHLPAPAALPASQVVPAPPEVRRAPPPDDASGDGGLQSDGTDAPLSTVEDDLRALDELRPLLHESVYVRFQERILFRRFPHLRS